MTMKNDAKSEEESTYQCKIDMRPSSQKSQNFAL